VNRPRIPFLQGDIPMTTTSTPTDRPDAGPVPQLRHRSRWTAVAAGLGITLVAALTVASTAAADDTTQPAQPRRCRGLDP